MSDMDFKKMLGEHAAAYAEAEAFDDWMPEEGEYTTLVKKVKRGSFTKDNIKVPFWRLTGQIQDPALPEYDQREYSLGFFNPGSFRGLKTMINQLTGTQINSLEQADDALDTIEGLLVKASVKSTYSDKHKRSFFNVGILAIIPTEATEAVDPEPAAEVPDVPVEEPTAG